MALHIGRHVTAAGNDFPALRARVLEREVRELSRKAAAAQGFRYASVGDRHQRALSRVVQYTALGVDSDKKALRRGVMLNEGVCRSSHLAVPIISKVQSVSIATIPIKQPPQSPTIGHLILVGIS